jgi:hypothetical protein
MDMTDTIEPKSDQMNADDLMSGPRTFTIAEVRKAASPEQPVDIVLAEFPPGRPFKPSKSMRRVLVALWGKESSAYVGRRLTLYRDPEIKFGGDKVGGVRISHMSHLPKRETIALTVTRGKRAPYVVEPLPDAEPTSPAVSAETLAELTAMFRRKGIPEDKWLAGANHYTGGAATALEVITEEQARRVLAELGKRPDADEPQKRSENRKPAADEPVDPCPVCGADTGNGEAHDDDVHAAAGA